ncbi:MAG: SprT family zinc-dependent metalloprotease [Pseudomonadota bacterium]
MRRRAPVVRREESLPLGRVLAGLEGDVLVKRSSARRTLALRVAEGGQAIVNAPLQLPLARVEAFLALHRAWLAEHLGRSQRQARSFAWEDGARLPWQGGHLTLVLEPGSGRPEVRLEGDRLHCAGPLETLAAQVVHWYRRQARAWLAGRLAHQATLAGRPLPPLRLSDARTRWGSLSPGGVVSLNWRLLKVAPALADYVICHELAHFRQRNHSPAFWAEVARLYPDWREARRRLREQGAGCFLF